MRVWFSIFLPLFFVCQSVYAEQATPPELLSPVDATKNSSKQAIKFSWQKAANAIPAKVYAYNLLISENSRFNGYSSSTSSCNNSCIFAEVDSTTFNYTTDLRLSNKVYYWKVQAAGAEKGAWSTTRTIQTKKDIVIPTISSVSALPNPVVQNNTLNFSVLLSSELPKNYSIKVDYGNGLVALSGSGTVYNASKTQTKQGVQTFNVGIYDKKNTLQGKTIGGQFEVIVPEPIKTPPILKLLSGSTSAVAGEDYAIQFEVSDFDNNLNSVIVDWGDGSSNPQSVSNGSATLNFSHSYADANSYTWSATAYDNDDLSSSVVTQNITVTKPVAKLPTVSSITATPTSVTQGNSIKFATTLSAALPTGYSVKVDYGNGLVSMSGSGTSYSVSQTPTKTGMQTFSIGIYDNKSILKSNSMTGNFEVTQPVPVNAAPTLSFISGNTTATTNTTYSVQLQATDANNNLSSITIDWGDGASDSQAATNNTTLTFSHTYTSAATYNWSATAYDSSSLNSSAVSKNVTVSKNVVIVQPDNSGASSTSSSKLNDTGITTCSDESNNGLACPINDHPNQDAQSGRDVTKNDDSDGHAGFSFTKISSTGATLAFSATSWNCVKDNVTSLMWEIKTTDGGLHDWNHTYTWYEPDNTKNGGSAGTQNGGSCKGSDCDTNAYVKAVNAAGYCGYKDWRLPTVEELLSIVSLDTYNPAIDINYFPNTQSNWFWSSSPSAYVSNLAWYVDFYFGYSDYSYKSNGNSVRLVRG